MYMELNTCSEITNNIINKESITSTYIKKNNMYNNLDNLDKFLENEKINNSCEPWSKLDKTAKIKKLTIYAEIYRNENNLSDEEYDKLLLFFKDCLDRKKLQRVKDVSYDKNTGLIKNIPALVFNKSTNNYTLKNIDKRISTIKSLAPKKGTKTIKNKVLDDSDDDDES
jgi:hypothetical protein